MSCGSKGGMILHGSGCACHCAVTFLKLICSLSGLHFYCPSIFLIDLERLSHLYLKVESLMRFQGFERKNTN